MVSTVTMAMVNAEKVAKKHRILAICNMYELESKETNEIAKELGISEAEVVNTLEAKCIPLRSRWY